MNQVGQSKIAVVVAWVASAVALMLALLLAFPYAERSAHQSALIGSWTTELNGQESGVRFEPGGKGEFTAEGVPLGMFEWHLKTPGVVYIKSAKAMYLGYSLIPGKSLTLGEGSEETIYKRLTP